MCMTQQNAERKPLIKMAALLIVSASLAMMSTGEIVSGLY